MPAAQASSLPALCTTAVDARPDPELHRAQWATAPAPTQGELRSKPATIHPVKVTHTRAATIQPVVAIRCYALETVIR